MTTISEKVSKDFAKSRFTVLIHRVVCRKKYCKVSLNDLFTKIKRTVDLKTYLLLILPLPSTETTCVIADYVIPSKFSIYHAIIYHLLRDNLSFIARYFDFFARLEKKNVACPLRATIEINGYFHNIFFVNKESTLLSRVA